MKKIILVFLSVIILKTVLAQSPPTVTTTAPDGFNSRGAILRGIVNANGSTTRTYFQFGSRTTYGNTTTGQNITGTSNTVVTESITLAPNELVHYRIVGQNAGGISFGENYTFSAVLIRPVAPIITRPNNNMYQTETHSTFQIQIGEDDNHPESDYVIRETTTGQYVSRSTGGLVSSPQFLFKYGTYFVTGLQPGTTYTFEVGVRRASGTDITFGPRASATTTNLIFYPRTGTSNLTNIFNWTTNPAGGEGGYPRSFSIPDGLFIVNTNVSMGIVPQHWIISGGSTVRVDHVMSITPTGRLTVGAGSTFDFNHRRVFIESNSVSTGSIGTITGTITNATNLGVERFIPARRAWRMINTPLTAPPSVSHQFSINSQWQERVTTASPNPNPFPGYGTHITGGTVAEGFDQSPTNASSMKTYDIANDAWVPVPNTNATPVGSNVFMLFVRGDRSINLSAGTSAPPTNTILRSTGYLRTGDQTFAVSAAGFTPIPNPYPSAIDFATITRNNVQNSFYVWDPKMSGPNGVGAFVNVSFNGTSYDVTPTPVSPISQIIQSHQSFLVRSTGTAGSLVIKETDKTPGSANVFRTTDAPQSLRVNLLVTETNNTTSIVDGVLASYNQGFSNGLDDMDVIKMTNFNENIGIVSSGQTLTVERRSQLVSADTVHLKIWNVAQKSYKLQFEPANLSANVSAYLVDNYLRTRTAISTTNASVVDFNINADAASAASDRFMIVYMANSTLPVHLTLVKAYQQNSYLQVDWNVATETDVMHYEVEKSADGRTFTKVTLVAAKANNNGSANYSWLDITPFTGNNFYRIKIVSLNGAGKYSQVVNVITTRGKSNITTYPNPLTSKTLNVQLISQPAGTYVIELFNTSGQAIYRSQIKHLGGSSTETLQLDSKPARGIYRLNISNGNTRKSSKIMID